MLDQMQFTFSGRWSFRIKTILTLLQSGLYVIVRRMLRGPLLPSWTFQFEASSHYQKAIYRAVYALPEIEDGRELIDALILRTPSLEKVRIEKSSSPIKGAWYHPESKKSTGLIILYCHGAYAFYAAAEKGYVADLAVNTGVSIFALDYRLTPENSFPAQLGDAVSAYDWLLELGHQEKDIIVMGTSAGGNLCLSLIQELRDSKRPPPRRAITFSPWTDIGNSGESIDKNEPYDILDRSMLEIGARWLVGGASPQNPQISPVHADLRGLPPIYIQAGGKEIFIDMITTYHEKAKAQGVDIKLDIWESMNHVFQAHGDQLPEAMEAMQRIAKMVHQ